MERFFSDPEVMASMSDPDIIAAMTDMQSKPANMSMHLCNPKVAAFFDKMERTMGGGGGGGGAASSAHPSMHMPPPGAATAGGGPATNTTVVVVHGLTGQPWLNGSAGYIFDSKALAAAMKTPDDVRAPVLLDGELKMKSIRGINLRVVPDSIPTYDAGVGRVRDPPPLVHPIGSMLTHEVWCMCATHAGRRTQPAHLTRACSARLASIPHQTSRSTHSARMSTTSFW
jgi:hypothetical protein